MSTIFNKSGGYRKLHSFNFATIVHLGAIAFCKRFVPWQEDPLGQMETQEEDFVQHGGIRERMHKARTEGVASTEAAPACPKCDKPMRKRTSAKGEFWGCTGYPECKGTREVE